MKNHRTVTALVLAAFASVLFIARASAQTPDQKGITITPALVELVVTGDAGQSAQEVLIKNTYDFPVRLSADFQRIDETAGTFTPSGPIESVLSQSLSLSDGVAVVAAQSVTTVVVTFKDTEDLPVGGHYATLNFTQLQDSATENLVISPVISIPLFLVKSGGEKIELQLEGTDFNRTLFAAPSTASLSLKNTGNVHLVPRASITIRSRDGKTVYSQGIANTSSRTILPNTTLAETVTLNGIQPLPRLPVRLLFVTEYRADGFNGGQPVVQEFWYVPPHTYWLATLLIIVVVLGIRRRLRTSRYKRVKSSGQTEVLK